MGRATREADGAADKTVTGTTAAERQKRPFYYGWWIVISAGLINSLGGSIHWQGFAVFFLPVSESLNLSRAATALPFALARAEGGLMGPVTGWLIDKYGVRPLMITGTILVGVGYIWLSRTSTYLAFLLVYLFVISVGASTTFMQATTAALNAWFIRRRGMAMSVNSAAFRLGGAIMVPLLSVAVLRYGWEAAAFWVGILMLAAITPLALVFRRSPESMGLRPDGDPPRERKTIAGAAPGAYEDDEDDWSVGEALRSRAFYVLALGTVLRMSAHGTFFVHVIAILVWKGESQQAAANMLGLLALLAVPLILFMGWLSDRVNRQVLLSFLYMSSGTSLLLLIVADGTVPTFLALLLFAGSEAGAALNWALVGDMFGRRKFATIRGMLAPIYNTALLIMPVAAGLAYDITESYRGVLFVGGLLMFGAAITFFRLKPPERAAPVVVSGR
ncbi:MAG: MFS transporter [Dehalococcoidia bacterium]